MNDARSTPQATPSTPVLDAISDAVLAFDHEDKIHYLNEAACRLFSTSPAEAIGRKLETFGRLEADRAKSRHILTEPLVAPTPFHPQATAMVLTSSTRRRPVELVKLANTDHPDGHILIIHDRSADMELRKSIAETSRNDPLTGLLNRYEFDRCLTNLVDDAEVGERTHALLYIDLDQFKVVNDSCGHEAGDELLRLISARLQKSLQQGDIVARLGGDEFGVLLCQTDQQAAVQVGSRICQAVSSIRFAWGSQSFAVGASIGIALIDEFTRTSATALKRADSACYAAKDLGRNRVHTYTESDKQMARREGEMQWLSRINHALKDNRLRLMQQRIMPLQSDGTRDMAEVLIRIVLPDGSDAQPGSFIPAAERYNMMPMLDRWVVREMLQTLARGDVEHQHVERYAINLSGLSIGDPEFLNFILDQFDRTGASPSRVCFEITETAAVTSFSGAVRFMSLLREIGCQFALDDFGSGMSSFGYLRELPVDYLKIDGMFVCDLEVDPFHQAIVRAIAEVDRAAGMKTIAEHVDSERAITMLREMGVDYVQGYMIERPRPFQLAAHAA